METLEQEEEPASQPASTQAGPVQPAPVLEQEALTSPAKKGAGAFLKALWKAIWAPNNKKTAEQWRDECRAKNPWWGNGI